MSQILREMKLVDFRRLKTAIVTISEALNFDLHIVNSSSEKKVKNSQLPNFRGTETLKIVNLEYPN